MNSLRQKREDYSLGNDHFPVFLLYDNFEELLGVLKTLSWSSCSRAWLTKGFSCEKYQWKCDFKQKASKR